MAEFPVAVWIDFRLLTKLLPTRRSWNGDQVHVFWKVDLLYAQEIILWVVVFIRYAHFCLN